MFNLIVSQGRVADKTAQTIVGAARTAKALEHKYQIKGHYIGKPAAPANDDWRVSLPQAKETLIEIGQAIMKSIQSQHLTVLLSNTCSVSLASLPKVAQTNPDIVVLWIDAHGDFNTPETTSTGYLGGMVLAATCGLWDSGHGSGLDPKQVILIGARDIDQTELELIHKSGVRIIPPSKTTPETILKTIGHSKLWIHIDWDALEPGFVPADYKVPNGLLPTQLRTLFETIPAEQILGIELAEFKAPFNAESSEKALSVILDIIEPVLEMSAIT
ncbi:MAG TPA: arginase family protein [Legionellaceae bacterium]|nr:arginase family protein [Legionellaceae bacterium]